ncbi:MAG: RecB-like helicase [Helicobacteraceae bacterium]|nr:RecB-like helicase [Helicobacteraceae bacterium]
MKNPLLSLSASAGSGKTYSLTMRYLNLLFNQAKPQSILTLTFTKKAAKEMEERIIKAIRELYYNKSNIDYIKNFEFITINNEQNLKEIETKISNIYHNFLKDDLKITTIDSFFQKILKNFCWYVGVDYHFNIKEDDIEAISEIFLQNLAQNDFEMILNLCYQKRQSLDSILKLCVYLDAFKELLDKHLFIKDALHSSEFYEEKAMESANKLKESYFNFKGTLHKQLDFNNFNELLKKGSTWLTKDSINEYSGFSKIPFNSDDFESLKLAIAESLRANEAEYLKAIFRIFNCFLDSKEQYYKQSNSLSFNAIASKVYTLLTKNLVSKDFLYFRLDSVINHILIDEFQDTSTLQYDILKPLIDEIKSGKGQKDFMRSFFYVGDIKQSIYRFRGGNPKLFNLASKGLVRENLKDNYRSAKEIVEFVNNTFINKFKDFIPQNPKLSIDGFVSVKAYTILNEGVLESIKELKKCGVSDDRIAILVFKNDTVVELAQFLEANNFKVVIDTSAKLIYHNEVRAIIQALKFINSKNTQHYYEFCTLLGFDRDDNILNFLNSLNPLLLPSKIILEILKNYKIASLSVKKFLESTLIYHSLEALLKEVESLNLDIASSDFSGIRIMTIHKSKGLEFEHVIIADKIGKNNNSNSGIFFSFKDNGVEIDKIFKNSSPLREALDNEYKAAKNKENALKMQDTLSQLYVAFTRAKNTMQIIKLEEKSIFEILNLEEKIYGNLESAIKNTESQKPDSTQITQKSQLKLEKLSLKDLGRQKEMQVKETIKEDTQDNKNLKNINFGIALHFALEQKIKYNLQDSIIKELLCNKMGFYLEKIEIENAINRCNFVLKNEKFIEIMEKGLVKCEIPFLSSGRQKRIDLLIDNKNCAYIIDYKSGIAKGEHTLQVKDYVESVQKMLNKPVEGYIFYLLSGEKGNLVKI